MKKQNHRTLKPEALEDRRMMAADGYLDVDLDDLGWLEIHGSEQADYIYITPDLDNYGEKIAVEIWDGPRGPNSEFERLLRQEFDVVDINMVRVEAFGGDDFVLHSESFPDWIYGGEGDDEILAGQGVSYVYGGNGNDEIFGRGGDDNLRGENGDDDLFGGLGDDDLRGELGIDNLFGDAGDDDLRGGEGDDELDGGAGDDDIYGDPGNDLLDGSAGNDELFGGSGNDKLLGGYGSDTLKGQHGKDLLIAGYLQEYGISFQTEIREVIDEAWGRIANMSQNNGSHLLLDELTDVFGLQVSTNDEPHDSQELEAFESQVIGQDVDYLYGGQYTDVLIGDNGTDYIYGEDRSDFIFGAGGADHLYGGSSSNIIVGGSGSDRIYGGSGSDKLFGGTGSDSIYGQESWDYIYGESGNDRLYGGGGDDYLHGQAGSDQLYGGMGVDRLWGGTGNDFLDGNGDRYGDGRRDYAKDYMYGGSGYDTFSRYYGSYWSVKDYWGDFSRTYDRVYRSTGNFRWSYYR